VHARPVPSSYSEIKYDVSVAIYLCDVLEFCIGNDGHRSGESVRKLQRQAYVSLSEQTEEVVLAQIGSQVERIQRVSVGVVFAIDKQSFVGA